MCEPGSRRWQAWIIGKYDKMGFNREGEHLMALIYELYTDRGWF